MRKSRSWRVRRRHSCEDARETETTEESPRARRSKPASTRPDDWTWADPKALKVNPEFQRLIPLQSRGEYLALSESIQAEGCRDPLLVWKGHNIVLDGHTRRDLCIEHEKKVKVREIELADEKAAVEFILQIQRQRRNLTAEAMSYFRGADYNAVKQLHGGNRRGRRPRDQSDTLVKTAVRLAEKYGVSEMTIKRDGVFAKVIDKIVTDYGDPEIKRKLLGADVKLTHGLARHVAQNAARGAESRRGAVGRVGRVARAKKEKASSARQPKEVAQSLVTRLKAKGDEHALAVLEQMARLLGREVSEKPSEK